MNIINHNKSFQKDLLLKRVTEQQSKNKNKSREKGSTADKQVT
jgi:hypothetical protein